ncbi:S8 family serine peptidase, partial [Streptomyces sp. H27-D2]|uniref:S8 family serine peptidase n=1 Tax=Streptomyces sp. H27-D2 TaxID=3046304 RepID=UPI002DBE3110
PAHRRGGVAALAALSLIPVLAAPAVAVPRGDSPSLPGMPSAVAAGQPCTPASKKSSSQLPWAQSFLNLPQAWQLTRGAGVTVAVVDTGGDSERVPSLAGRVTAGPDVVSGGAARDDCVGHGTFLAGIVAGRKLDGTRTAGVAPEAKVLAIRATDKRGVTSPGALAKGVRAATESGARVIDVALSSGTSSAALRTAVRAAQDKGALVIAPAAAEDGGKGPSYPAALPGVLAVSSVGPGGAIPDTAGAADGAEAGVKGAAAPRLSAPGVSVTGPGPGGPGQFTGGGDAVAGAFVSGTAALVISYHPRLTARQVAHRLESTAYGASGDALDPIVGRGTVDPVQAVSAVLPEEHARPAAAPAVHPPAAMPPARSSDARDRSVLVAVGAGLAILLIAALGGVLPRGRRRGWRAGRATG